jgi:sugar phosphate isomerase/epimerase
MLSRRAFALSAAGLSVLPAWAKRSKLKFGVTDWNLRMTGKVEAVAMAKQIGFAGVEVSLGRKPGGDKLPLDDDALIAQYNAAFKAQGIVCAGTCLDILHVNYLKSDKLGQKWVADSIPVSKKLGAKVILLPFFGKGALQTPAEMDYVGDFLKEVAPEAKKHGVTFGLEDTLSAENNVRIMDRSKSPAVKVYYDVGNSTNGGFDIIKELNWLTAKRICQIHLKDNPSYLGEGKIKFPEVMSAIMELGFEGFANLETDSPSKKVDDDMKRNLAYVERLTKSQKKGQSS